MEEPETVQEYLSYGNEWLSAAERAVENEPNPSAFNALHSIELHAKAALKSKTGESYKTHRIGGAFGKEFKEQLGRDICRELNKKMIRYDGIRYPNGNPATPEEAGQIVEFAKRFREKVLDYLRDL